MADDSSKLEQQSASEWSNVRRLVEISKRIINGKKHREIAKGVHQRVQACQEAVADQQRWSPAPVPSGDLSRALEEVEIETAKYLEPDEEEGPIGVPLESSVVAV